MYDYGKGFFLNSAFLTVEQEISRLGKFKIMLHFPATKMCLFMFIFLFELPALEVPHLKFKKAVM